MKSSFLDFADVMSLGNNRHNQKLIAAENFGHNYVGSEHILLALVKEEAGTAYTILNEKGITVEDIENFIKENMS